MIGALGREVCVNWVFSRCKKIGGEGKVVEIDELKFGKRKYNVGRVVEGQWVFWWYMSSVPPLFYDPSPRPYFGHSPGYHQGLH